MDEATPTVLILPAMAVGSRYYRLLVDELQSRGWDAEALPRKGFEPDDAPASRREDWSYADEIDVVEQAVARVRAERPGRPVLLLGHSMGGQLALGHQLTRPPADGVVTVGGALPDRRNYPRLGLAPAVMGGVIVPVTTTLLGHVPRPAFGAPGARTLMREWGRMAVTGRTPFGEGRVGQPALLVSLEGDSLAPERAVHAFGERFFDPERTTLWTYTDAEVPEGMSNAHLAWARTPAPVVDRMVAWWAAEASRGAGTAYPA